MKGSVSLPRRERERDGRRDTGREGDHPVRPFHPPYHFHLTARFHSRSLAFRSAPSTLSRIHVLFFALGEFRIWTRRFLLLLSSSFRFTPVFHINFLLHLRLSLQILGPHLRLFFCIYLLSVHPLTRPLPLSSSV